MAPRLIEPAVGSEGSREIMISKEEFLIGRGSDCDLRINDEDISRHHCLLRTRGIEVTLSDLGSSNGTFVNAKRVLSQVTLASGDEVRVGKCRFVVALDDGHPAGSELPQAIDSFAVTRKLMPHERGKD